MKSKKLIIILFSIIAEFLFFQSIASACSPTVPACFLTHCSADGYSCPAGGTCAHYADETRCDAVVDYVGDYDSCALNCCWPLSCCCAAFKNTYSFLNAPSDYNGKTCEVRWGSGYGYCGNIFRSCDQYFSGKFYTQRRCCIECNSDNTYSRYNCGSSTTYTLSNSLCADACGGDSRCNEKKQDDVCGYIDGYKAKCNDRCQCEKVKVCDYDSDCDTANGWECDKSQRKCVKCNSSSIQIEGSDGLNKCEAGGDSATPNNCAADSYCDEKSPGEVCGTNKICSSSCTCIAECPEGQSCMGVSECQAFGGTCKSSCSMGCCCLITTTTSTTSTSTTTSTTTTSTTTTSSTTSTTTTTTTTIPPSPHVCCYYYSYINRSQIFICYSGTSCPPTSYPDYYDQVPCSFCSNCPNCINPTTTTTKPTTTTSTTTTSSTTSTTTPTTTTTTTSSTTTTMPSGCGNGKCEFSLSETQANCPRDCTTTLTVYKDSEIVRPWTSLLPNQKVRLVLSFNDSRYNSTQGFNLRLDASIDGMEWSGGNGCSVCGKSLDEMGCDASKRSNKKCEGGMGYDLKAYMENGYGEIEFNASLPSNLSAGPHVIRITPVLLSRPIELEPAEVRFNVVDGFYNFILAVKSIFNRLTGFFSNLTIFR